MATAWKKGRGKLGFLQPLHGRYVAQGDSPLGPVRCTRLWEPVLGGKWLRLTVRWERGEGSAAAYEEHAMVGRGAGDEVVYWSFTSDGKHSQGTSADVSDLHPEAIGFVAEMPAGTARQAYWPDGEGGYWWVVEAARAKGWQRFVEQHYRPADGATAD